MVGAKLVAHTPLEAMTDKQLKAFLEAVKADAGLQEQIKAAGDADAVAAIANRAGFVFSAEELQKIQEESAEDELEGIVGGQNGCAGYFHATHGEWHATGNPSSCKYGGDQCH